METITWKELEEQHEKIKKHPFRKAWNDKYREDYYTLFKEHVSSFGRIFYYKNGELQGKIYSKDFWWIHDILSTAILQKRKRYKEALQKEIDLFMERVLLDIHVAIEDRELTQITYPDGVGSKMKGFKVYQKKDGTWTGIKYYKFSEEIINED